MTDINRIRSLRVLDKKNPYQIALATGHSWATTSKYISITPEGFQKMGKRPNRKSLKGCDLVLERIKTRLLYEHEAKVPRKQRITTQALVDRLTHNCEFYTFIGESVRFIESQKKIRKEKGSSKTP